MPGVGEVAVIGVPDERWGERVHAIVVPKQGATLSADDVIEHCRGQIAGYKCPRSVDFRDTSAAALRRRQGAEARAARALLEGLHQGRELMPTISLLRLDRPPCGPASEASSPSTTCTPGGSSPMPTSIARIDRLTAVLAARGHRKGRPRRPARAQLRRVLRAAIRLRPAGRDHAAAQLAAHGAGARIHPERFDAEAARPRQGLSRHQATALSTNLLEIDPEPRRQRLRDSRWPRLARRRRPCR